MQSLLSPSRAGYPCPSPVEIWQLLLTHLLEQHYGLTLNDTPLSDESVILDQIEAGYRFAMPSIPWWKNMTWCALTVEDSTGRSKHHS
jgi:hypothetical protein